MKLKNKKIYWKDLSLSFSGWRRIFSLDRKEHSRTPKINQLDIFFLTQVAEVLKNNFQKKKINTIVFARDSRPTGKKIEEILLTTLLNSSINILNIGIVSLPQSLAYVKKFKKIGGLIYLTASHNPVGHNGIKLGDSDGKIISVKENNILVEKLKERFFNINEFKLYPEKIVAHQLSSIQNNYFQSSLAYKKLIDTVIHNNNKVVKIELEKMQKLIKLGNYLIICDFNGSSRLRSYDLDFYRNWGINFLPINDKIGKFNHGMVPEGNSLTQLKNSIIINNKNNNKVLFGYAVDCDGDRGNLAIVNSNGEVNIPDAQTSFAIAVLSELLYFKLFFPQKLKKLVLVCNGPTSLRIDWLGSLFGVKCVRAEVGEINVITLAEELETKGKIIRIVGEGSNGGNITFPSTVRDPLMTVVSIMKLLFLSKENISLKSLAQKTLFLDKSILNHPPAEFLFEISKKLNCYYSTNLSSSESTLKIKTDNQKQFKNIYEDLWEHTFNKNKYFKNELDIQKFQLVNYEETKTRLGKRSRQQGTGGLKVSLYDSDKNEIGFLWFRVSRTEKLLRFSSEFHNEKGQKKLLLLQRKLLKLTDSKLNNY